MNEEIIKLIEKALEILSWCQENADEKWMVDHLMAVRIDIDKALALLKQQSKDYPTRTIENTYICPCGNIFVEDDDYDTAGSESGVCCPDCGNEKFQTVKDLLKQQPPAE